jgi:hypothetical protein
MFRISFGAKSMLKVLAKNAPRLGLNLEWLVLTPRPLFKDVL